ncbi:MAG: pyruvate carboxylase subunit B [Rhodospirillaceae bacterium]|jgi:oxaloacetate decarboxylase alpha subunit
MFKINIMPQLKGQIKGMAKKINLIDVTLRDAHQCLWATRMTTGMMRETAPLLDKAGFEAIDLVGGAVFDVCVRYLREDPWERMRILSTWVTETPLIIHHRGQSLFTFELFADDVVELTAERIAANGMRYHTTYDALNDIRNLEVPVRAAKNVGLTVAGGVVFTETPVHTDTYYERKTKELLKLGVDAVYIKDPSGLLRPERVATLVPALKKVCGKTPLQLHSHCLSGLGPYVAVQAIEHGVDCVHTATSTLANAASHPPTELFVKNARRRGFDIDIDLGPVEQAADIFHYIAIREDKPTGAPVEYDEFHYHHQVPGGMISNLKSQLQPLGIEDKLEEILEEAGHVRRELGYPIPVSPFAQYIMTQAVLNVMGEERYATVPDEVRKYVLGAYGEIAGPIDPNLYDRITQGEEPSTERPGALVPPALERLRKERGPFMSDDDLLLAAYYDDKEYTSLKAAGPIKTDYPLGATPLETLLKEITARRDITYFSLTDRDGHSVQLPSI